MDPSGASKVTYNIGNKYNKPVVFAWGLNCRTVYISAYCGSNSIEAYIPHSGFETDKVFNLLRARKAFQETRILYPTNWGWPSVASVTGVNEPEKLKDLHGIGLVTITYDELSKEMDKTRSNEAMIREAEKMSDVIFNHSNHNFLDKQYVTNSMQFYQTVIQLMQKHDCNAFIIECFEFCVSRLPQKWNTAPCLIHTMFKDLGIPSACEGDFGGLLAMHLLMSVSKKSAHMGNMFYRENGN